MIFQNINLRNIRRLAIEQIIASIATISDYHPNSFKARSNCIIYENVPYSSNDEANILDIYCPKKQYDLMPIIMYIHGGGFTTCSKHTHRQIALIYANRGYLVFNIDYRLSPKYRYPCAFEDVCQAFEWIVQNANQYGGNTNRLVIAGDSAGANLTLALTLATCYKSENDFTKRVWNTEISPKAIKLFCGLYQVTNPMRLKAELCNNISKIENMHLDIAKSVSIAYLGSKHFKEFHSDRAFADPLLILENESEPDRPLPAIYAMVGEKDILLSDTKRLEKNLIKRNTPHEIHYYPNENHIFHLLFWKDQARKAWRDGFQFLSKYV